MVQHGFRVWVVAFGLLWHSTSPIQASYSFRKPTAEAPRSGSLCRRMLLGGAIALGIGYFWFTDAAEVAAPPPLVLEEKPSPPPTPMWREEAKGWETLLSKGDEVTLDIRFQDDQPIELRLFDKNCTQRMLADMARLNNAVNRPDLRLGKGPGFVVTLEKAVLKVNERGQLDVVITSQLGSLRNAEPIDFQKFLQGATLTVPLAAQQLEGEKGAGAVVEGSMQFTLRPKENRVQIDAGKFRVTVNVPALGVKNESDEAPVRQGFAKLNTNLTLAKPQP